MTAATTAVHKMSFAEIEEEDGAPEVVATENENKPLETLLKLPPDDFFHAVSMPASTVFHVPLNHYPMQPWSKAAQMLYTAKTQEQYVHALRALSQWFNFGLHPKSFQDYAAFQLDVAAKLAAHGRALTKPWA